MRNLLFICQRGTIRLVFYLNVIELRGRLIEERLKIALFVFIYVANLFESAIRLLRSFVWVGISIKSDTFICNNSFKLY